MPMTETVESYHKELLDILNRPVRAPAHIGSSKYEAIRALIEKIHDAGYLLGQLHADGIFPEEKEDDVADIEDRLKIPQVKREARQVLHKSVYSDKGY